MNIKNIQFTLPHYIQLIALIQLIIISGCIPKQQINATQTKPPILTQPALSIKATNTIQPTQAIMPSNQNISSKTPTITMTTTPKSQNLISEKDGMQIIWIPEGEFIMGSEESNQDTYPDEFPIHNIFLDGFWIDKTEITNAMFEQFIQDTGYTTQAEKNGWSYTSLPNSGWNDIEGADWKHPLGPNSTLAGKENHPVVHISWKDANNYCIWAGRRLPTEAEWEKASRGVNQNLYPWGNQFDSSLANINNENQCSENTTTCADNAYDGFNMIAPVGSFPGGASPYGALDMAGNVGEWVADWYSEQYYAISPDKNPTGPENGKYRVSRGSSWDSCSRVTRTAFRDYDYPDFSSIALGFRCATISP